MDDKFGVLQDVVYESFKIAVIAGVFRVEDKLFAFYCHKTSAVFFLTGFLCLFACFFFLFFLSASLTFGLEVTFGYKFFGVVDPITYEKHRDGQKVSRDPVESYTCGQDEREEKGEGHKEKAD